MAEGLATTDGTVLDVAAAGHENGAREFATAMAAPEPGQEIPAPPKKEPADPQAPYGRTKDGTPKKGPGGRPSKADQPRTTAATPAGAPAAVIRDYTAELAPMADTIWSMMAMAPVVPVKAQAALFRSHQASLVHAGNIAAQNNAYIRKAIETTERGTWVMVVAMAVIPFAQQSIALWRHPGQMTDAGMPVVELLAAQTQRELDMLAARHAQERQAA